jgi:hypothetical protein
MMNIYCQFNDACAAGHMFAFIGLWMCYWAHIYQERSFIMALPRFDESVAAEVSTGRIRKEISTSVGVEHAREYPNAQAMDRIGP